MALLGLGFSFGAKDNGLSKTLGTVVDGFKALGKEILTLQRLQTVLSALSLDKLQKMANSSLNLTSSLEGQIQQMDVSSRKMGLNLGMTADQLAKFSQQNIALSRSLGISAEEAGKAGAAMQYFKKANKDSTAVGEAFNALNIKTTEDMAKFATMLNIDPYQFTYGIEQMNRQLKLSGPQINQVMGALQTYGAETGNVSEAMGKMGQMQQMLAKVQSTFNLDPQAVANYGQKFLHLATSLQKTGVDGFEMASTLGEALRSTESDFGGLLAGVQSDLPQLIKELNVVGLGSDEMFAAMQQGPMEFIGAFAKMVDAAEASGQDVSDSLGFIKKRLSATGIGEEGMQQITRLLEDTESRKALSELIDPKKAEAAAQKGVDALKNVKGAFRSTLTEQERYNNMQEDFLKRIRTMGTQTGASFLKDARKSFKTFGDGLNAITKEGGPLSSVVKGLVDVQKFGVAGIFPTSMRAGVAVFGDLLEKLAGPMATIRALGIDLLSPMGLLTGAFGLLAAKFISLRGEGLSTADALKRIGEDIIKFIGDIPAKIDNALTYVGLFADKLLDALLGGKVAVSKGAKDFATRLSDALKKAFTKIVEVGSDLASGLWAGLTGRITKAAKRDKRIGGAIGLALRKAAKFIYKAVSKFAMDFWEGLNAEIGSPQAVVTSATSFGKRFGLWVKKTWPIVRDAVINFAKQLWDGLTGKNEMKNNPKPMGERIGLWLRKVGLFVWKHVKAFALELWAGLTGKTATMKPDSKTTANRLGEWLREVGILLWEEVKKFSTNLIEGLKGNKTTDPKDGAQPMANSLGIWLREVGLYLKAEIEKFASDVWKGMRGEMVTYTDGDSKGKQTFGNAIGEFIKKALELAFEHTKKFIKDRFNEWWSDVKNVWSDGKGGFMDNVEETFKVSLPYLLVGLLFAPRLMGMLFGAGAGMARSILSGLGGGLLRMFTSLVGPSITAIGNGMAGLLTRVFFPALEKLFLQAIPKLATMIWGLIPKLGTAIWGAFTGAWSFITTGFVPWITGTVWPAMVAGFKWLVGAIAGSIGALALIVLAVVLSAATVMLKEEGDSWGDAFQRVINRIKAGFYALGLMIVNVFIFAINGVIGLVNLLVKAIATPFNLLYKAIGKVVSMVTDLIASSPKLAGMMGIEESTIKSMKEFSAAASARGVFESPEIKAVEYKDVITPMADYENQMRAELNQEKAARMRAENAAKAAPPAMPAMPAPAMPAMPAMPAPAMPAMPNEMSINSLMVSGNLVVQGSLGGMLSDAPAAAATASPVMPPFLVPPPPTVPTAPLLSPAAVQVPTSGFALAPYDLPLATPTPLVAQTTPMPSPVGLGSSAELLAATNNPSWYTDYKALCVQQHSEMLAAIKGQVPQSPTASARGPVPPAPVIGAGASAGTGKGT